MDTPSWKQDIIEDPNHYNSHYMLFIKYLLILLHALIYFSGHQVPFLVVQLCSGNEKKEKMFKKKIRIIFVFDQINLKPKTSFYGQYTSNYLYISLQFRLGTIKGPFKPSFGHIGPVVSVEKVKM
jgi:hypothetical protein